MVAEIGGFRAGLYLIMENEVHRWRGGGGEILPILPANRAKMQDQERATPPTLSLSQPGRWYSGNIGAGVSLSCLASHARISARLGKGGYFVPRCIPQSRGFTPCTPDGSLAPGTLRSRKCSCAKGALPRAGRLCAPHPCQGAGCPLGPPRCGYGRAAQPGFWTPALGKER